MTFDIDYAIEILPRLLWAARITLFATVCGFILAVILGMIVAMARLSTISVVAKAALIYTEFLRSTPLLVQLFYLFYVLPAYGVKFEPLVTGIVALGVHFSAYTSEVYRAAILAVPRGQWEASAVLGIGQWDVWRRIVLPQAIPPIVPVLGNYLISMFKDTPLLATITVQELVGVALGEANRSFRYLEPFTLVGLTFLALSLPAAWVVAHVRSSLRPRWQAQT